MPPAPPKDGKPVEPASTGSAASAAKELSVDEAADTVLAAVRAKDDTALRKLAESDGFDGWVVADELLARGESAAATRFATATSIPDLAALAKYIESRRGTPRDPTSRATLKTVNVLFAAHEYPKAAAVLDTLAPRTPSPAAPPATLDPVTYIRVEHAWGIVERELRHPAESVSHFAVAADAAFALGWLQRASNSSYAEDDVATSVSDFRTSLRARTRRAAAEERRGRKASLAGALVSLGDAHRSRGESVTAVGVHQRALVLAEEARDREIAANAVGGLGNDYERLGQFAKALEFQLRSLKMREAIGDRAGIASALGNVGNAYLDVSELKKALDAQERALAIEDESSDRLASAATIENIGLVYSAMGDTGKALQHVNRAMKMFEDLGSVAGHAKALGNLGTLHNDRGAYADAMRCYETAFETQERIGDNATAATTLGNIGVAHFDTGDYERAITVHREALARMEAMGDASGVVRTLGNIAVAQNSLGNTAEAITMLEKAVAASEPLGDRAALAWQVMNLGIVVAGSGDLARAIELEERARRIAAEIGDRGVLVAIDEMLGRYRFRSGERAAGLSLLEKAASEARRLRRSTDLVSIDSALAAVWLDESLLAGATDDGAEAPAAAREPLLRALASSREGLREAEAGLGGLSDDEGASARARYADIFEFGAIAAMRARDAAQAVEFLESGRAGALLDSLGGRRALRWADLPPALRDAEAEAKAAQLRARREYGEAADGSDLAAARAKAKALDDAEEASRAIAARIQREAKRQAGLFYPRAATLDEIASSLDVGTVLVVYSLTTYYAASAVVVTPEGARIVALGKTADVREAVEQAGLVARDAVEAGADAALARLRSLLVDPLALPNATKTVLVSPAGPLCFVPWGALFSGRAVALTPSGSTHVLLRSEERAAGVGVLALGDPVYDEGPALAAEPARAGSTRARGPKLVRLPATALEAKAVGDETLLGRDATEERLAVALKEHKSRWRAIHFACHGLVDPERTFRSSLALTRAGNDDGFLTAPEILRMEIPADLAVLSACQTATGKVVTGEGVVGLTRAFMFAGAPRVLCSLWKVDDEATRALMTEFYRLWNPRPASSGSGTLSEPGAAPGGSKGPKTGSKPMGTAQALRTAQEFVRSQPKWKHPYYWAAWVLWGLP